MAATVATACATPARSVSPPVGPGVAAPPKGTRCIAVRHDDHLTAVARAIALCGGLDEFVRGDTALLKVNTNSGDPYPYSTSPKVVAWLAKELVSRGVDVVVGDRSFWGDDDTRGNLERNGIAGAARDAGAKLVVFEGDAVEWIEIPADIVPSWVGPVRVPRLVRDGKVINLPCVKTHFITGCTLSLKNALGLVHPDDRARPGNLRSHAQERIYRQVAEINAFFRPVLNVLDGHRALVTGGPTPGSGAPSTFVDAHTVIASRDRIATDAAGIAMLRTLSPSSEQVTATPTWESPTLVAAIEARVGSAAARDFDLQLEGFDAATTQRWLDEIA